MQKILQKRIRILRKIRRIGQSHFKGNLENNDLIQTLNQIHLEIPGSDAYFRNVADQAVGLTNAQIPYNCHPDLMKRFIRECFGKKDSPKSINKTLIKMNFQPIVRVFVISAQDLPAMDANNSCDPYFKVFTPSIQSNRCVYISAFVERTRNPVWNASFAVPLTWSDIRHDRAIRFQAWDKDPSSIVEALREMRTLRNWRNCGNATKDFLEVVCSTFLRITVDDKIGEWQVPLSEVPATGASLCKRIVGLDKRPVGSVQMAIDWGSKETCSTHALFMHLYLYVHSINWHLNNALIPSGHELDIRRFLYMPALTLINQHRVQIDLSWLEDASLRRCALLHLITDSVKNQKMEKSDQSKENETQINIFYTKKLILCCMLANEELSSLPGHLKWNPFPQRLLQCEHLEMQLLEIFLTQLHDELPTLMHPTYKTQKQLEEQLQTHFLQQVRIFANFDRRFPLFKWRTRVNTEIAQCTQALLEQLLPFTNKWSQLLDILECVDECLLKHWSQGLLEVLGEIRSNVKRLFSIHAQPLIEQQVQQWQTESSRGELNKQRDQQLLQSYIFTQRLDQLLFSGLVSATPSPASSIETLPENEDKNNYSPVIMLDIRKLVLHNKKPLNIAQFKLDDLCRWNSKSENIAITCFPLHLLHHWLTTRARACVDQVESVVQDTLKNLQQLSQSETKTLHNKISKTTERYFFDALGATMYLFVRLQHWQESLFEASVEKFCECILLYADQLVRAILAQDESFNQSAITDQQTNQAQKIFLLSAMNEIYKLENDCIKHQTVEMFTDQRSNQAWAVFEKQRSLYQDKQKDLPPPAKIVFWFFEKLDSVMSSLRSQSNKLVVAVGARILCEIESHLRSAVEQIGDQTATDIAVLVKAEAAFQRIMKNTLALLHSKVHSLQLINYIKIQLDNYLKTQFNYLINFFEQENLAQKARRHLTKIEIIRLVSLAHKLKQSLKQFIKDLNLPKLFEINELNEYFIDSEELDNLLQPILFTDSE